MRILTAEAMQQVDRAAIEEIGIPSMVLMENAALAAADALGEAFPEAASAAILCGPGNNGGDGLAMGRHLANRGYQLELILATASPQSRLEDEAATDRSRQLAICQALGMPLYDAGGEDATGGWLERVRAADVVVDALFGTGLKRPLAGRLAGWVEALADLRCAIFAIDLPSGLNASSCEPIGPHTCAQWTVTFAAPKVAHVFLPVAAASGEVVVADIGIPLALVERAPGDLDLLAADELAHHFAPRPADAHKGDFGHVLIFAGSTGKAGAAVLAARAAVRAGAGLVTVAVPAPVVQAVDAGSVESMTLELKVDASEGPTPEAAETLLAAAESKAALAVGPGLGLGEATVALVQRLVGETTLPLILDADGLNAFAGELGALAKRAGESVLTPHPAELGRLLGRPTGQITGSVEARLDAVRTAAQESNAVVVLKGHQTLVADPLGGVYVNSTGNPGMATGGSGDVLTGLIGGLLAQGHGPLAAAQLGTFIHGLAGDRAAAETGEVALTATDLVPHLAAAIRSVAES